MENGTWAFDFTGDTHLTIGGAIGFGDPLDVTVSSTDNTLTATAAGFDDFGASIDLAADANLTLSGQMDFAYYLDSSGGNAGVLANNGNVTLSTGNFGSRLEGKGTYTLIQAHDGTGNVTVNDIAGANLTFALDASPSGAGSADLTIAHPHGFQSAIAVTPNSAGGNVILDGITATSDDLSNDTLTLFNGSKTVATMHVDDSAHISVGLSDFTKPEPGTEVSFAWHS